MTNPRIPLRARLFAVILIVLLASLLPSCGSSAQGVQILPALKQAGLNGRLIFILYNQNGNQVVQLDLASGQMKTLFAAPNHSWLASAEVSPDGKEILIAYAPPPPNGQVQLANTDLYQMPADGSSAPQPLMQRKAANESFTNPTWAPDGQTIYYTHTIPSNAAPSGVESQVERVKPGGQPDVIAKNAIFPSLSRDGTKVSYLALAQFTSDTTLSLANADGSSPKALLQAQQFPIVDAHRFAPDGQSIYYSAPDMGLLNSPARGRREWWFSFGVQPAAAHNNPSDWFKVGLDGGKPQLIARTKDVNMIGTFSKDGQWFIFASQKGLFLMKPDGSQLTQLATLFGMGSMNWVP